MQNAAISNVFHVLQSKGISLPGNVIEVKQLKVFSLMRNRHL